MKKLLLLFLLLVSCSPLREIETTPTPTMPTNSATATAQTTATNAIQTCTVTAGKLHMRSGNSVNYPVIEYLYAGDVLTLNDTRGNWYEVTNSANVAGWINSKYYEKRKP